MKRNPLAVSGNEEPDNEARLGEVPGVGAAPHFPIIPDEPAGGNAQTEDAQDRRS